MTNGEMQRRVGTNKRGEPLYQVTAKGRRYVERTLALADEADENGWRRDTLARRLREVVLRHAVGNET